MKASIIAISLAVALALAAFGLRGQDDGGPPPKPDGAPAQADGGKGKPPGDRPGGFHLLPRFAVEKLNLTEDQLKRLKELEKETKRKLDEILTPDQIKMLDALRPPPPPPPGEGGPAAGKGPHGNGGDQDGGQSDGGKDQPTQ
jgi:hypothetical protein